VRWDPSEKLRLAAPEMDKPIGPQILYDLHLGLRPGVIPTGDEQVLGPDASSRPATSLRRVVLPQPEGPSNTQNSPSATSNEISSSTFVAPNDFESFCIESEAISILLEPSNF
jgi:hypothetical protein